MSRSRDIANFLGKTEIANTTNNALLNTTSSVGLDSAQVLSIAGGLTVYATLDDLPTSDLTSGDQAFITATNRIYVSNGAGWYNVALFNATPTLNIDPSGAVTLATDGSTPTVITLTGTDSDNADASLTYTVESDGSFSNIATLSQDSSVFTITPLAEGSATPGSSTLTFKVSDGISFGSGTTEFSLTFGPDWANPTETIFRASDASNYKTVGFSVTFSSDGNYAIAGSSTAATNGGAAYILTRSGSTWTQQAKIIPPVTGFQSELGYSVSMNEDGTYALLGAPLDGGYSRGCAYVFTRSGSTWSQQAKLVSSDLQNEDRFGDTVSISSDGLYAIVGSQFEDGGAGDPLTSAGAAYIFTRSGSTWTEQAILRSPTPAFADLFGGSVSINSDGSYVAIGARGEDTGGNATGSVYIFTRSGSTWTQQTRLNPATPIPSGQFGMSVSMSSDGDYVLSTMLAQNKAYIFTRSGSTWTEQAILSPSAQGSGSNYGKSGGISTDGIYAIVGDWVEDGGSGDPYTDAGAAYVYERSGSTWSEVSLLRASNIGAEDRFGSSVAIHKDGYAIVGAHQEDGDSNQFINSGAAYIYEA